MTARPSSPDGARRAGAARAAVAAGGARTTEGLDALDALDAELRGRGLTAAGSPSLLAGALFPDGLTVPRSAAAARPHQTGLVGEHHRLDPVPQPELGEDPSEA